MVEQHGTIVLIDLVDRTVQTFWLLELLVLNFSRTSLLVRVHFI